MKLKGASGSKPPGSVSALQDQLLLCPTGCPLPQRGQQLTARVSHCHPPHWSTQTLQPLPVFLCHKKDSRANHPGMSPTFLPPCLHPHPHSSVSSASCIRDLGVSPPPLVLSSAPGVFLNQGLGLSRSPPFSLHRILDLNLQKSPLSFSSPFSCRTSSFPPLPTSLGTVHPHASIFHFPFTPKPLC